MSDTADLNPGAAPAAAAGNILHRLWRGEVPLASAFWSYAVIGGTALNAAATLLAMAVLTMDAPALLALLAFALPIPYNLLVLVAIWRSANAYQGPRLWADLARIAGLLWAVAASTI